MLKKQDLLHDCEVKWIGNLNIGGCRLMLSLIAVPYVPTFQVGTNLPFKVVTMQQALELQSLLSDNFGSAANETHSFQTTSQSFSQCSLAVQNQYHATALRSKKQPSVVMPGMPAAAHYAMQYIC